MKLLYILFLIIIIIIIFYILNNNIITEKFSSIYSATPGQNKDSWTRGGFSYNGGIGQDQGCEIGASCNTDDGFGTFNKDCVCIVNLNSGNNDNTLLEGDGGIAGSNRVPRAPIASPIDQIGMPSNNECHPISSTNFDKICKTQTLNPKSGIKSYTACADSDKLRVECEQGYINGVNYGTDTIITPCLNKSDDFNTWCKYYNNSNIPEGYSINSIGVKKLLIGEDGDCFLNDGTSDINSARAICDYNNMEQITKLDRAYNDIDYNKFTSCSPIRDDFSLKCSELLGVAEKTYAVQIMGYDCNPGYGRAKCLTKNDYLKYRTIIGDEDNNYNETTNEDNLNNCPCVETFDNFDSLGVEYNQKMNNLTTNILLGENNSSNNSLNKNGRDISKFNIQPQTSPIVQQIIDKISQLSDQEKAVLFNNIQNNNNNITPEKKNEIINKFKQMTPQQKTELSENIKNKISMMSDEKKKKLINSIQEISNNIYEERSQKLNKLKNMTPEERKKIAQNIQNKISIMSDEEKALLLSRIQNNSDSIIPEEKNKIIRNIKNMTPEQKAQLQENIKNKISIMSDEEKAILLDKIQNKRENLSPEQKNKIQENIKNKISIMSDEEKSLLLYKMENRKTDISPEQKNKIQQNINNKVKNMTPEEKKQISQKMNDKLSQITDEEKEELLNTNTYINSEKLNLYGNLQSQSSLKPSDIDLETVSNNIEDRVYNRLLKNIENKNKALNQEQEEEGGQLGNVNKFNVKTWKYKLSLDNWFNIPQNNFVCRWKDLNIDSNTKMSISFWLNISSLFGDWRNIIHFSNNNNNCCNSGDRIPAIWVSPNSTNLLIVNDLFDSPNQYVTLEGIQLNTPTYITITWDDQTIITYLNTVQNKSFTYPLKLINTLPESYFYIGDPWHPQNNGVQIKNLSIFNTVLNQDQLNKIYKIQNIINNLWVYPKSMKDWYTIVQNNLVSTWKKLKISSNSNMSVSFWLLIKNNSADWNNIFHFTNNNVDCCNSGNRVPGVWVYPNNTNLLIVNDLESAPNQYTNITGIELNKPTFIVITWLNQTINTYINNTLQTSFTYNSKFVSTTDETNFYIGDPWYPQNKGLQIKKFNLYNTVLNEDQIKQLYNSI